jgi:hypothetical protein
LRRRVWSKSTDEMLAEFLTEAEFGRFGVAPGFGMHTLAAFSEADVVPQVPAIIEADPDLEIAPGDVLSGDVRESCLAVAASAELFEEKGFAGIIATLFALSHLSFTYQDAHPLADRYHTLLDFVGEHTEAGMIFAAID